VREKYRKDTLADRYLLAHLVCLSSFRSSLCRWGRRGGSAGRGPWALGFSCCCDLLRHLDSNAFVASVTRPVAGLGDLHEPARSIVAPVEASGRGIAVPGGKW